MGQPEIRVWHLGKKDKLEKQVMQAQCTDDSNGHVRPMFPIRRVQGNERIQPEQEPSGEKRLRPQSEPRKDHKGSSARG